MHVDIEWMVNIETSFNRIAILFDMKCPKDASGLKTTLDGIIRRIVQHYALQPPTRE